MNYVRVKEVSRDEFNYLVDYVGIRLSTDGLIYEKIK